jgi:hypothetical protein
VTNSCSQFAHINRVHEVRVFTQPHHERLPSAANAAGFCTNATNVANERVNDGKDTIRFIPRGAAVVPAVFPENRGDLLKLSRSELITLLSFYELPTGGTVKYLRRRLADFIGVPTVNKLNGG